MKKVLPFIIILYLVSGCGKDDSRPDDTTEVPTAATLIFPYENSLCNEGTDISDTQSTVHFEWEAGEYTDEYELNVKNLNTGSVSVNQTTAIGYSFVLDRATPYAWFVVSTSLSVSDTAHSETWKFYNAGKAIESYAPFPADIVTPAMAETLSAPTGMITLDWTGGDVDGDIAGYDVYFGTVSPPGMLVSDITESMLSDVSVASNTIYFWRVITKDFKGNTSDSGIYQFKIQ